MVSWRVTFYIGSVHPLQAVPFSDFWTDLQQDAPFIGCQISLQRCNPFQRKRASFCRGSFICTVHLLPNVHVKKNCFSENKRPAFTMHQVFAMPKRSAANLPWTQCPRLCLQRYDVMALKKSYCLSTEQTRWRNLCHYARLEGNRTKRTFFCLSLGNSFCTSLKVGPQVQDSLICHTQRLNAAGVGTCWLLYLRHWWFNSQHCLLAPRW